LSVTISNNLPTPEPINGSTSVCPGISYTYSVPAVSGASTYTWALPSGWTGSSTTSSIQTTAGASGGNITVKANNSCGSSALITLMVSANGTAPPTPGSISGTIAICAGISYTYSILPLNGATSYTWTLPSGWTGSSTTNSIQATAGISSGDISVKANNSCGSSSVITLAVSTNGSAPPTPGTISGNVAICPGSTNTYSVQAVNGATSYTWTLPFGWTGSSLTNSITVTAGTSNGLIIVAANNSCGMSMDKIQGVTVTAVNTSVSQTGTTLLADATGATFQWINCTNGNPIAGQTNPGFTATSLGNYAVIVTRNNCSDTSSCFNISTVGLNDNRDSTDLIIYPNPSRGRIQVKIDGLQTVHNSKLEIYNLKGNLIYQSKIKFPNSEIELTHQTKGIYYLKFYSDRAFRAKMFVIH